MTNNTENKTTTRNTILRIGITHILMISTGFSLVLVAGVFLVLSEMNKKNEFVIEKLQEQIEGLKNAQIMSSHYLISTVTHNEDRRKRVLFLRDVISNDWLKLPKCRACSKITPEQSFDIAKTNIEMGEIYPEIDPLLLAALQWQESKFNSGAVSPVGAIGISQIMPTTGRMLAGLIGLSYNKRILYDTKNNIRLSAKYLDILYQEHGDWEVALAEYNGGPWGAYYYRTGNSKLATETKKYVPAIMKKWAQLKKELMVFKPNLQEDIDE